ncbi:MAG: hypothetical protein IJ496_04805 [Ruminococcus sp.]|nr:hypothetical protein [Ruminococcus sp.]
MEKDIFRNMMGHIKMSSSCEQEILRKAAEFPEQTEKITMKTRKKHSPVLVAIAACLCVALVGTVTASALQDTGWLVDVFSSGRYIRSEAGKDPLYQEELYSVTEEYICELQNFKAEGKYAANVTPVGAISDGQTLYVALRYVLEEEENVEKHVSIWHEYEIICGNERVETSGLCGDRVLQEDGSFLVWAQFRLEQPLIDEKVQVEMTLYEYRLLLPDYTGQIGEKCTLSFTTEVTQRAKSISYAVDETILREIEGLSLTKYFFAEQIELSALYMKLCGDAGANPYSFDIGSNAVITEDGEEIECYLGDGITSLQNTSLFFRYARPIDPETIVAVKFGDQVIPLDQ